MYKRLYKYKDLFYILIWRELLIRYKQTAIGVLWALIQPLSMMLLFVLVFGIILNIDTGGIPKPLFYFVGLVPWTFFSSSISASIDSFVAHRNLITKIYFPRELLIFSRIMIFLADFTITFILLALLIMIYRIPFSMDMLWAVPLTILLLLFTTSVGMILATINVYYRDVRLASAFLLRLWFFATPVFYSIDTLPIKFKLILFLNPLTYVVENLRRVLLENRGIVGWQFMIETVFVLFLFILSYRLFIRLERSFADVI
ncbi:ABC transporter permease [Desulfobacula sp.]|uniref:ABC transporter permease n=1 Tax=Desulfobacula sp. TaxID=2593537 RepID=UPI00262C3D9C|nr:ABC transporter permease [Desulfobacula sp.]